MNGINLIHYFVGPKVWQCTNEVFPGEGKYIMKTLNQFQMTDFKSFATPMIPNMKLHVVLHLNFLYSLMYIQFIGSLMYLVNTINNICSVVNTLGQYMVEMRKNHWVSIKHVL
jgi:hypothetical protein